MNEYFTIVRTVAKSTDELLAGCYHSVNSVEIKNSAGMLQTSLQPFLDELRRSATQLKPSLEVCLEDLDSAEDVWQSKQRVAEASTAEIWENIGVISGRWNRVRQLANESKAEVIKQVQQTWLTQFEELKKQFFFDAKAQRQRTAIGWSDKDGFNRDLPGKLSRLSESLDQAIKDTLQQLLQGIDINHLEPTQRFLNALDQQSQLELSSQQLQLMEELNEKFSQAMNQLSGAYSTNLSQVFHGVVDEWRNRFGDISSNEVEKFREKVLDMIEVRVELIINDRLVMIDKVVEWALAFYNDFLDKQKRYQQETLEQRLAEKAWIDQQRQHLHLLLANLEKSLEFSECSGNS
jgi:hypothetical protein